MAVIIDIGEARDIHPRNKQDVGSRLAQWALHHTYGKDIVPSGPLYKSHKAEGGSIRIAFDCVGKGLMVGRKEGLAPTQEVPNGKLQRFAVAGADKQWHWADAVIDGETIVVSCKDVPKPVAVRYAFSMNPEGANLYNREGLPASPFRTDAW
jgi:sialate O-acetylesterase